MPIYQWKNVDTDEIVQVVRSFADIEVPPGEEDGEGYSKCKWSRIQCAGATFKRGQKWGKKGDWPKI